MRAIATFAVLLSAASSACAGNRDSMTTYGYAFPPPAFNSFCASNRTLCSTTGGAKTVRLTPARRAELRTINAEVNRNVVQRNDSSASGGDRWQVAGASGDCEDIAIRKKKELLKRGWPASSLLLTVARLGSREDGHTLLTVRTSEGDLILDNTTSAVRNWRNTGYRYFARQSQDDPGKWDQIR